jgi:parvulin-like peptidyl-prolyl isomerase
MPETLPLRHLRTAVPSTRSGFRATRRALVCISALALFAASCSSGSDAAAAVNGQNIDRSSFDHDLSLIAKNKVLKARAVQKNGKLDPAVSTAWLTALISNQVAEQAVRRAGTKIIKADRTAAQQWGDQFFGTAAAFAAFPKSFRDAALARYAYVPAFVRTHTKAPTDADLMANYNASLAQSCASRRFISHILVASEAEANTVAAELAAGTSFAQVAASTSTDTQSAKNGGALGCIDGSQVDPAFAAAVAVLPLGQVSAPVKTQYGWHVIKAEDVGTALPFAKVKEEIRTDLVEHGPAGQKQLVADVAKAKVTVADSIGRWVVSNGAGKVELPKTKSKPSSTSPTTSSSTTTLPATQP